MTTDAQPNPDEPHGLAMLGTVRWAFGFVFHNFGSLLKISITPFILTVVLTNAQRFIQLFGITDMQGWGDSLFAALLLAAVVPQATAWHRYALLPDQRLRWCQFVFGSRELKFFALSLVAFLGSTFFSRALVPFILLAQEFWLAPLILGSLFMLWVMARCTMFLPAASVGSSLGFGQLFRKTKGRVVRIVGIYFTAAVLMMIFGLGFASLSDIAVRLTVGLPDIVPVIAETLPRAFFNLLAVGVSISILSSIYKQILEAERSSENSSDPQTPAAVSS